MKKYLKTFIFFFLVVKFSIYLNKRVYVMNPKAICPSNFSEVKLSTSFQQKAPCAIVKTIQADSEKTFKDFIILYMYRA